jgi:hypothetical protein
MHPHLLILAVAVQVAGCDAQPASAPAPPKPPTATNQSRPASRGDVDGGLKLGVSNRSRELLEKCVAMVEKDEQPELAQLVLQRYTGEQNIGSAARRQWLEKEGDELRFDEAAGVFARPVEFSDGTPSRAKPGDFDDGSSWPIPGSRKGNRSRKSAKAPKTPVAQPADFGQLLGWPLPHFVRPRIHD